jgi:hypothetical protein
MKRRLTAREFVTRATRVTAYVLAVTVGLGVFCARQAHARAKEGALLLGEQLLRLSDTEEGNAHELSINGQTVHVTSAHTSLPLGKVLERFQTACEEHADGMVADLADLESSFARAPAAQGFPGVGMLRDDRDGRGVVACFAAGREVDTSQLGARLERFSRSYDFADLGDLRYVAARSRSDGTTDVVASWTEGQFRLGEMFPAAGDATGEDPHAAPRPGAARRILSARDARAPYGVFLYELRGDAAQTLASYTGVVRQAGWVVHEAVNARDESIAAFERSGVDVIVTVEPLDDGLSLLSIVEMPAPAARKDKR